MHIKSKLRFILSDLLAKSPVSHYRDRISNKRIIKNVIIENGKLPKGLMSQSQGGLVRILASNKDNANQIAELLLKHKDDLALNSIAIADTAIEYSSRPKCTPLYSHSVLVKLHPKSLIQTATSSLLPHNIHKSLLKREVLEVDEEQAVKGERIVIDFSSPNIAKPFHFGHLKSTILGNFLANMNTYFGNEVTKLNYIGDWGTQYGLLNLGLEKFSGGCEDGVSIKDIPSPLRYLLDIYVKANQMAEEDKSFYEEARRRFLAIDNGTDDRQLDRWREIRDLSLVELKKSYSKLGVEFDVFEYESDYSKDSLKIVEEMKSHDSVKLLDDGLLIVQVERNNRILDVPILKSDGACLYITRDITAAIKRKERYNYDKMLYVVGADQEKHFYCLSKILKNMGHNLDEKLIHVKMGKVLGMSSRSGNFLLLSDIIDNSTKQYIESTRNTPTSKIKSDDEQKIKEVARHLALSALFVYDMRNPRTMHYHFDWAQVMQPNVRSGINLQTTFARLSSLIKNAALVGIHPLESPIDLDPDAICCLEGMNLLSRLDELDTELHSAYWSMDPASLVNYTISLCQVINRARQSTRMLVLSEPNRDWARTRLSLFKSAHSQLELIIKIIGLKPLYEV